MIATLYSLPFALLPLATTAHAVSDKSWAWWLLLVLALLTLVPLTVLVLAPGARFQLALLASVLAFLSVGFGNRAR